MKTTTKILGTAALAALLGSAAGAATVTIWTEGNRDIVDGTSFIVSEAKNTAPGEMLGTVDADNTLELYGRIVGATDFYQFTADVKSKIVWIFNGYTTGGGAVTVTDSGFVIQDAGAKVNLALDGTDIVPPSTISADITSGNNLITTVSKGTYTFSVDGLNNNAALYDIRFVADIPLPAGGALLLTGLAGLGLARRKKA